MIISSEPILHYTGSGNISGKTLKNISANKIKKPWKGRQC
jgi:hypothetical protein